MIVLECVECWLLWIELLMLFMSAYVMIIFLILASAQIRMKLESSRS
jgi:hypothetical protein